MKKLAAVLAALFFAAAPAAAEVRSVVVCDEKTLAASGTTDCTPADISGYRFFSFQVYCGETTGNGSMSIDVDWVARSGATGSTTLAIPILASGTAMSQLISNRTTEDAWSTLQSVQPPVSPVATIRFTEDNGDDDIVCSAVINMGN